ncbi:MAG: OmpA family protein [Bacteroidales bacterium]|nr:OmpA family protein [Bacteroidales bacterium]
MRSFCLFFTTLLTITVGTLSSQELHTRNNRALRAYTEGREAYNFVNYSQAEKYLSEATERDENFIEAFLLLAELYKDMKRYDESARAYDRVQEIDSLFFAPALFSGGEVHFLRGDYSRALEYFRKFMRQKGQQPNLRLEAEAYIRNALFAIEAMSNPVPFNPVSLGDSVNTRFDEYWPAITIDGKLLMFTRQVPSNDRRIGATAMQEDFYYSTLEDSVWQQAVNIGTPLNTPGNEGALTLSVGGQFIYYTACNRPDATGGCDIYYSYKGSRGWSQGMNPGAPLNSVYWESQPSLSSDGQTLFFVSNRPGGEGGMDIWISRMNDAGAWGEPENAGNVINTPGDEMSPFIHFDNRTLYFSSDGRACMGGLDIFRSEYDPQTGWSEPVNLGYPINTQFDEMGLVINSAGDVAYYSSTVNRQKGRDLFSFELPEEIRPDPVSYVEGTVTDRLTGERLKASYELINLSSRKTALKSVTDNRGNFLIPLPSGINYGLNVMSEGYLFYSGNFMLEGEHPVSRPYPKEVMLNRIDAGESMSLYNVFFDTDSWELLEESLSELSRLYDLLVANPGVVIEIGGHTDSSGSDEHNLWLSGLRALAVSDFLIGRGIEPSRLMAKGYGESRPVADNSSEEGMRRNRRTEITIISK